MNIMPASLFHELRLLDLCRKNVVVQLVDRSLIRSFEVVKEV